MSFLDNNSSEYLTGRITQNGRKAIAAGSFNINYFAAGDSEFNYGSEFSGMTGSAVFQKTFAPMDKDTQVKYPIQYTSGSTIYGIPVTGNTTTVLRNAMGPAGFVSDSSTHTIECITNTVPFSGLTGTDTITVTKTTGTTYDACQYITLAFDVFSGSTVITGLTNSLVYKLVSVSGATSGTTQTLTLDRSTPILTGLTGNANVICNKCENEFDTLSDINNNCLPPLPDPSAQHNAWTLDVVWSKKPIGIDESVLTNRPLSGYTGNKYMGVKEFLGYKSTNGQLYNTGTTYTNSYDEVITKTPEEQKCIALIHYSEIGDIVNDPDRFFKYDDYISTTTTGVTNDKTYFEIYIPFLMYHRNTGTTFGAIFKMGDTDKEIISNVNNLKHIKYRDLIDEQGVYVGKIFVNNKLIVFDDEEIVATLDYKSNRKYTLPAPKIGLTPSVYSSSYACMSGTTGQTMWLTYVLANSNDTKLNGVPCNYLTKVTGTTTPSEVIFSFNGGFSNMTTGSTKNGFSANKFYVLAQIVNTSDADGLPDNNNWRKIDFTSQVGGDGTNPINPTGITGSTFTITKNDYTGGTIFDLTSHLQGVTFTGTTATHFGDTQPFPGSVKLVRASDIEEMNFLINLPSDKFNISQNPSNNGQSPMITEIALLDSNKNALVMAKAPKPIKRTGAQIFSVKLDF